MRRLTHFYLMVLWCLGIGISYCQAQNNTTRQVLNMNPDWEFAIQSKTDENPNQFAISDAQELKWKGVHLPHTPMVEPKEFGLHWQGVCWYKKQFYAPSAWQGKRVTIKFEAVMQQADVWINGKKITQHLGGFLPFTIDVTSFLNFGDKATNTLLVRADNRDNPDIPPGKALKGLDMTYQGGIYRSVNLTVSDPLFISDAVNANKMASGGIFVSYPEVTKQHAKISVKTHVVNSHQTSKTATITQQLIDESGEIVAFNLSAEKKIEAGEDFEFTSELKVNHPKLWHPNSPNRYTLVTQIREADTVIDEINTKIGIRHYEWKNDGFYINGEKLLLYGANRHQDGVFVGNALSESLQRLDAKKLREAGFNNVRAGHYPLDPAFMDACDEYGLTVIACIPGWHWYKESKAFKENSYQNLRDLVRRDRNHPSVILYETILNETRYTAEYALKTLAICKEEDPTAYAACDYNYPEHKQYDVNYKVPDDSMPSFTREWGDDNRYCGIHKDNKGYTWGDWADRKDEHSMVYQSLARQKDLNGDGYWDWYGVNANPNMAGYALWVGFDHNRGATNNIARCGVWDLDRYPKFCHYFLQSQRDPNIHLKGLNSGPMVFIGSYWQKTSLPDVNVYSNCEKVRLYLNGKLVAEQYPDTTYNEGNGEQPMKHVDHPMFTFKGIKWETGILSAQGLINGKVVASHKVSTPNKATKIIIEKEHPHQHMKADGSDMAMIYLKAVDANGNLDPNYNGELTVEVKGEATLIGSNPVKVEGGVGSIFVRSTTTPDVFFVSAYSPDLTGGVFEDCTLQSFRKTVAGPFKATPAQIRNVENGLRSSKKNTDKPKVKNFKVKVSSTKSGYSAKALTDNDNETWWFAKENTNQSIVLQLKKATTLSGSLIVWEKDSNWYQFQIKVSKDGKNWKKVYEDAQTGHNFELEDWKAEKVKFVKIELLSVSPADGLMGIREINLFQ
ncbi:DUF4982 domain-containing protein [Prolixibacteraceae bacterium JC049]|nr:DUF4982 domain-containing protein [Prolixibacteraceae bacterium JC049]